MTREEKKVYLGPQSRGEQALDRFGNLDGTGSADYGPGREDPGGEIGGAAVASDRRHAGQKGADAPSWQIGSNASDQSADQVSDDFRTPKPPRDQDGDPAPETQVAVPVARWWRQERLRRRAETTYAAVHSIATGNEDPAPRERVSTGQSTQLPPERFRTFGHVGIGGSLISVGGRSAQAVDWGDAAEYGGVPASQLGPSGSPSPPPERAQAAGRHPTRPIRFRDPIDEAKSRLVWWFADFFGEPEEIPPSARPR